MFATSSHPIRAAATAAAMGVTALFAPWGAGAQEIANAGKAVLQQPAASDFTKGQCVTILSKASEIFTVIGPYFDEQKAYNPELPVTFARYLAPNDAEFVQGFLLDHAAFVRIANSKRPEDLPTQRRLVAALTCNGPKTIVVSGGGVATWNNIRVTLYQESGISLHRAGVRGVLPEVVGSLRSPAAPKLLEAPRQDGKLRLN